MSPRRALALVSTLALTCYALVGCSNERGASSRAHHPPSSTSRAAPPTSPSPASRAATSDDVHTETSTTSPTFDVQWPRVPGDAPLSAQIEQTVRAWKNTYTAHAASDGLSDFTAGWQSVLDDAGLHGIRLTARTAGDDTATESSTLYGDGTHVWHSIDLVAPAKRQSLVDDLKKHLEWSGQDHGHTAVDSASPKDVLTDLAFDGDGDLVVTVAPAKIVDESHGMRYFLVKKPDQYLSGEGKRIHSVMTSAAKKASPLPAPAPPSTASPSPVSASSTSSAAPTTTTAPVDCLTTKCIAITYDDGPSEYTHALLDTLSSKHAKATFFMVGRNVQPFSANVRRMIELGMGIGDHTWSHPDLTTLSDEEVTSQITRTADIIEKVSGVKPVAVRPPGGAATSSTPHAGYPFVNWDVDTLDWQNRNITITTERALSGAHRGAIILMHDIRPTTVAAAPGIIDALQKQGYTLVTVPELLPKMDKNKLYIDGSGHGT